MTSGPSPRSPEKAFLQLRINQQTAVVNNQYHQGNLGYFQLPTGLELPDHGWHGGAPWGFRRSPAAEQNTVFERSPGPVSVGLPGLDEDPDRDSFDQIVGNLDRHIGSVGSSSGDRQDASRSGTTTSDVGRGFDQVSVPSNTQYAATPHFASCSRPRTASTASMTIQIPTRRNLPSLRPHPPFDPSDFISRFNLASTPLPPPVNPNPGMAPVFNARGVFALSTGTRPRRAKTHPMTGPTASTHSRGDGYSPKPGPSRTPTSRHRSHSVLDPPRDLHHQVRTYTVADPTTGEQISLLDDDNYDPPTSYKLSDIRAEDRERAAALGKRRCTRCRRWRPGHRFQHQHNRCIFCQARIDAGVWLVGNQKRKRPETIDEQEEDADGVLDDDDPRGALKSHRRPGGGGGGAVHAVVAY